MRVLGILFAALAIMLGLRMALIAVRTAVTGQVLIRRGFRSYWQPAPDRGEAWGRAFRDAIFGILLIILGVALVV